jgi:hypothetical protein
MVFQIRTALFISCIFLSQTSLKSMEDSIEREMLTYATLMKMVEPDDPCALELTLKNSVGNNAMLHTLETTIDDRTYPQWKGGTTVVEKNFNKLVVADSIVAWTETPLRFSFIHADHSDVKTVCLAEEFAPELSDGIRYAVVTPDQNYIVLASNDWIITYGVKHCGKNLFYFSKIVPQDTFSGITALAAFTQQRVIVGNQKGKVFLIDLYKQKSRKIYDKGSSINALCWISENKIASYSKEGVLILHHLKKRADSQKYCVDIKSIGKISSLSYCQNLNCLILKSDEKPHDFHFITLGENNYGALKTWSNKGIISHVTSDKKVVTIKDGNFVFYNKNGKLLFIKNYLGQGHIEGKYTAFSDSDHLPLTLLKRNDNGYNVSIKQKPSTQQMLFKLALKKAVKDHNLDALEKLAEHSELKTFEQPMENELKNYINSTINSWKEAMKKPGPDFSPLLFLLDICPQLI